MVLTIKLKEKKVVSIVVKSNINVYTITDTGSKSLFSFEFALEYFRVS